MLSVLEEKKYILNQIFNKVIFNFYAIVYNNVTCS